MNSENMTLKNSEGLRSCTMPLLLTFYFQPGR